jgi:hypothetical protein
MRKCKEEEIKRRKIAGNGSSGGCPQRRFGPVLDGMLLGWAKKTRSSSLSSKV